MFIYFYGLDWFYWAIWRGKSEVWKNNQKYVIIFLLQCSLLITIADVCDWVLKSNGRLNNEVFGLRFFNLDDLTIL